MFRINPEIDQIRARYKKQYDYILNKIHDAKDDPNLLKFLQDKEKALHLRTKAFISKHAQYFAHKRKRHFENMENQEIFGDRPSFEPETDRTLHRNQMFFVARNDHRSRLQFKGI